MSANATTIDPNPDLVVGEGDRPGWNQPDRRRRAFHSMHTVFRYSFGIRAPQVLRLRKVVDRRIGDLASVRRLTGTTYFSGMVAVRGGDVLFERYAPDFGPHQPHSVQSITKTTMNLVVGLLVERGTVDLGREVRHYLPDIGSGYVTATVQDGYDGHYMLANPDTGVVMVFFSVLENADAHDPAYSAEVIRMAEEITRLAT